ncbi:MAG: hypothetical protein WCO72_02160, partial [Betaproteobacteria bacterium]
EPQLEQKAKFEKLLKPSLESQHMASSAAFSSSAVRNVAQELLQHAQLSAQARRTPEGLKKEAEKK